MSQPAVAVRAAPESEALAASRLAIRNPLRIGLSGTGARSAPAVGSEELAIVRWATASGAPAARERLTTLSASRRTAGRCETTTTARSRDNLASVWVMMRSVSSSRCAVGSSRKTHGRSAATTRARASRARSPAESSRASSPTGLSMPSAMAATRSVSPTSRTADHTSRSEASGDPRRTLSAIEPARNIGRWGSQLIWTCHSGPATSTPLTVIRPARGSTSPITADNKVDLPQPDGPVTTVSPRSGSVASSRSRAGVRRSPYTTDRPEMVIAPGPGAEPEELGIGSMALISSNVAPPSAAAWNSAPTLRNGQ
jgi:hypothetical protein